MGQQTASLLAGRNTPALVSTGDQFYPSGLKSSNDPKIHAVFERRFNASELQIPWLLSLGNHDCYGSVTALTEYATGLPKTRMTMPSRYYFIDLPLPPQKQQSSSASSTSASFTSSVSSSSPSSSSADDEDVGSAQGTSGDASFIQVSGAITSSTASRDPTAPSTTATSVAAGRMNHGENDAASTTSLLTSLLSGGDPLASPLANTQPDGDDGNGGNAGAVLGLDLASMDLEGLMALDAQLDAMETKLSTRSAAITTAMDDNNAAASSSSSSSSSSPAPSATALSNAAAAAAVIGEKGGSGTSSDDADDSVLSLAIDRAMQGKGVNTMSDAAATAAAAMATSGDASGAEESSSLPTADALRALLSGVTGGGVTDNSQAGSPPSATPTPTTATSTAGATAAGGSAGEMNDLLNSINAEVDADEAIQRMAAPTTPTTTTRSSSASSSAGASADAGAKVGAKVGSSASPAAAATGANGAAAAAGSPTVVRVIVLDTCSLACEDPDAAINAYEQGECKRMASNLKGVKRADQLAWLRDVMADSSKNASVLTNIIVGHHPLLSMGPHGANLQLFGMLSEALDDSKTHMYVSGHDHTLQHINIHWGKKTPTSSPTATATAAAATGASGSAMGDVSYPIFTEATPATSSLMQIVSGSAGKRPHKLASSLVYPYLNIPLKTQKSLRTEPYFPPYNAEGLLSDSSSSSSSSTSAATAAAAGASGSGNANDSDRKRSGLHLPFSSYSPAIEKVLPSVPFWPPNRAAPRARVEFMGSVPGFVTLRVSRRGLRVGYLDEEGRVLHVEKRLFK